MGSAVTGNGARQVMDARAIERALVRIAHEILERNKDTERLAFVGIRSRGVHLAERVRRAIQEIEAGALLPLRGGGLTPYPAPPRPRLPNPALPGSHPPFAVEGRRILLVDDVLFTGRTVRAAMDALVDFGRPQSIQLAVLVDRGHRELPIRPDYVGKNLPTSLDQEVQVRLAEVDGEDEVLIETVSQR